MHTPEDYLLEALETVSGWDLPDDDAVVQATNQQARLMAGLPVEDEHSDTYPFH